MKSKLAASVLMVLTFLTVQKVKASDYVEAGRFGLEFTATTGNMQFGGVYVSDNIEVSLELGGSSNIGGNYQKGDSYSTAESRFGKRINIGDFNYITIGIDASVTGGQTGGVSAAGTYNAGAYFGIQRHFSGSHIMLNAYILPVDYTHTVGNDGSGNKATTNTLSSFTEGGIGIAYLF